MINKDPKKIEELLARGVEKIYPDKNSLAKKLLSGDKIRLYCGYDPSGPSLHLGHMVSLKKLSQFQRLGHEVIMLIGDFTGMIGDPTDKLGARKKLTREEVLKNATSYKILAGKFLDFSGPNSAKIIYNSQWSDKLTFLTLIELASNFTVQQMIARDMFQQRLKDKKPIYLHEFLYPLAQAYDSVALDVDLEIGGVDQIFNMLCGRDLIKILKNKEKFVLSLRLLVDPNGKKMGKTEGNLVSLDEKPDQMFGKIMSWPDELIIPGFELLTDVNLEEIEKYARDIKAERVNPKEIKTKLAEEVVSICYNKKIAQKAGEEFNKIFQKRELPSEIPTVKISNESLPILDLLVETKLVPSKSEAKRLILQKGVEINNKIQDDWKGFLKIEKGMVIKVGKRKFIKIT